MCLILSMDEYEWSIEIFSIIFLEFSFNFFYTENQNKILLLLYSNIESL
jgi:hypothetical protein